VRNAKYEDDLSVEYRGVRPYSFLEMKNVAQKIAPYIAQLRDEWWDGKEINFHFVTDEQDKVYFLNRRESHKITMSADRKGHVKIINTIEDLRQWNGEGDLLLKLNMKRGEEELLREYIPHLKKAEGKVFVEFGILSHPAILLRELGVNVAPSFSMHKEYDFMLP